MADIVLNDPQGLIAGGITWENIATLTFKGSDDVPPLLPYAITFYQPSDDLKTVELVSLDTNISETIQIYVDNNKNGMLYMDLYGGGKALEVVVSTGMERLDNLNLYPCIYLIHGNNIECYLERSLE